MYGEVENVGIWAFINLAVLIATGRVFTNKVLGYERVEFSLVLFIRLGYKLNFEVLVQSESGIKELAPA